MLDQQANEALQLTKALRKRGLRPRILSEPLQLSWGVRRQQTFSQLNLYMTVRTFFAAFHVVAAVWFIGQGARGVWRRELSMFGKRSDGREWRHTARGSEAVLAGLLWIGLGAALLYQVLRYQVLRPGA